MYWLVDRTKVAVMTMAACVGLGCPGDDGTGTDDGADSSATNATSTTQATGSDGASASETSASSVSATGSSNAQTGDSGSSSTDPTATEGDETGVATCGGGLQCAPGEICLEPCCGGPAPGCGPAEGETCPAGTHEVDSCAFGGDCSPGQLCCEQDACVPDPPSCVQPSDVMCDPVAGTRAQSCSDPCYGTLNGNVLSCECA